MKPREGNRGGRELFKWDDVKQDSFKDRENYLGYSTRVGLMGKFGKYIVHDWYINERQQTEKIENEMKDVQAFEEELMQEALGLKPKNLLLRKKEWTEEEWQKFRAKDEHKKKAGEDGGSRDGIGKVGGGRDELCDEIQSKFTSTEETKGLGYAPHRTARLEAFKVETLGIKGELEGANLHLKSKQEMDLEARMKYCGSSSSTGSNEPVIKKELKEEPNEAQESQGSGGDSGIKEEVKEEQGEVNVKLEKKDKKDKKKNKADKKDKKKDKKDKKTKKMKKKAKELEKIAKEIAKLKKKRKRGGDDGDSSSSSSSS